MLNKHKMLFSNFEQNKYICNTLSSNICGQSQVLEGVATFKSTAIFCKHGSTIGCCNGNIGVRVVTATDNGYLRLNLKV